MTDQARDSFETRLSAALQEYVAVAHDPRPASQIADVAMRPRGLSVRALGGRQSRRFMLFGLAAALLIPATYLALARPQPAPESVDRAIVVRASTGDVPGISLFAIRPDGAERLIREIPDSVLPNGNTFHVWGSLSETDWIALGGQARPWPMVLLDLRDPQSAPWIVPGAAMGAIGPAWGPNNMLAAPGQGLGSPIVIVDVAAHTAQRFAFDGSLIGGGPSIAWNADGSGIVVSLGGFFFKTASLDGAHDTDGFPLVYRSGFGFGDHGAQLRTCEPGNGCGDRANGQVERVELDDSFTTVYEPNASERVLRAAFGPDRDEYLLLTERDFGRELVGSRLLGGTLAELAAVKRAADWKYVGAPTPARDDSFTAFFLTKTDDSVGVVIVPAGDGAATEHDGYFLGFLDAGLADRLPGEPYASAGSIVPAVGVGYQMPPLENFIADEMELNPGEFVLAKGSRDGVEGEFAAATYEVIATGSGPGSVYFDCVGPAALTVTLKFQSRTNPCLREGSYAINANLVEGDLIQVKTTGEVSWRVVFYRCFQCTVP